jgi:hypothetical protein
MLALDEVEASGGARSEALTAPASVQNEQRASGFRHRIGNGGRAGRRRRAD